MSIFRLCCILSITFFLLFSCGTKDKVETSSADSEKPAGGQANVVDNVSEKDIVKVAVGSKDHTTLVAAIKAAELVDVLATSGPYTVFAPTNAAFDKLLSGTVEDLVKPENKSKLTDILYHHVTTSSYSDAMLRDGLSLGMVDGKKAKISRKDGAVYIDDAKILGAVKASNGMVYVIDGVILAK